MSEAKKSKILTAARSVFTRYGFRRVNMSDIAEAAGVSRAALYVLFRNKEDIFVGVYQRWVDEIVADIEQETKGAATPLDKLEIALEILAVRPFEIMLTSPESREIVECSLEFAQASMKQGYRKFETTIAPVLASMSAGHFMTVPVDPERVAHILVSAMRGFKQAATTPDELRQLIKDLLLLILGSAPADAKR